MNCTPDVVRVFGDWHADTDFALKQLEKAVSDGVTVCVHVGDFGVWGSMPEFYERIEEFLRVNAPDFRLFFIDGNHEDYDVLASLPVNPDGTRKLTDHITYLPRGFVWSWGGVGFAALGGAISPDRLRRTLGKDYFTEEAISEVDLNTLSFNISERQGETDREFRVHCLFTHDSPVSPFPPRSFGAAFDADWERNVGFIRVALERCKPILNVHGHYHIRKANMYKSTLIQGLSSNIGGEDFEGNYLDLNVKSFEDFLSSVNRVKESEGHRCENAKQQKQ